MSAEDRPRRLPLEELREIARQHTRAALQGYEPGGIVLEDLVLGTSWQGEYRVFELYLPGEHPQDARVLTRALVHEVTGAAQVEVFLPKKPAT